MVEQIHFRLSVFQTVHAKNLNCSPTQQWPMEIFALVRCYENSFGTTAILGHF
jgi:hypothetical protein